MLSLFHRGLPLYYLILCAILGLSLAWAVTSETSLQLSNNSTLKMNRELQHQGTQANQRPLNNRIILQRNVFNSSQPANPVRITPTKQKHATTSQATATLTLIGTVVANDESLAVINTGQTIEVFHLNTKILNDDTLVKVERDHVVIESKNGSQQRLELQSNAAPQHQIIGRSFASSATKAAVQHLGGNRWRIPTTEAKKIRTNIASIIKQIRIDPHIVNGETDGFVIKRIQRNTLLSQMGLKRGDILHAVNGVTLNSPEKGLQIFQQLREAKSLSLDLKRADQSLNFQYEIK